MATAADEVGSDCESSVTIISAVDGSIVVEELPVVEAYPKPDERGPSIEEFSTIDVTPMEVVPLVEGATTTPAAAVVEMQANQFLLDGVPAPDDSSSAVVDRDIVEEVL